MRLFCLFVVNLFIDDYLIRPNRIHVLHPIPV